MFNLLKNKKTNQDRKGTVGANDEVRKQLAALGDDGTAVRHVAHYAHPLGAGGSGTRKVIDKYLREMGFRVKEAHDREGIVFEKSQSVAAGGFDDLSESLSTFFEQLDWEYNGWECTIATPGGLEFGAA